MIAKLLKTATLATPAFAMLALAQPAHASDGAAGAADTVSAAAEGSRAAARAAPKKYCANIIPDTGTRLSRRVCRTRQEWSDEGAEIRGKD